MKIPVWLRALVSIYVLAALLMLTVGGASWFLGLEAPAWIDVGVKWWALVGLVVTFSAWVGGLVFLLWRWVFSPPTGAEGKTE